MPEPPALTLMKSQASKRAGRIQAGADLDQGRRTEIGPGELLLTRPAQGDGPLGRAGQAGRFDRRFARVFSAEPAARVGHDHPHVLGGHVERGGQLAADAERILGARPDGELVAFPLGHGGPGLHRRVLDIGDLVAFVEDLFCAGEICLQPGQRSSGGVLRKWEKRSLLDTIAAWSSTWPSWPGPRRPVGLPGWWPRRSRPASRRA